MKKKILIIEDDTDINNVIAEALGRAKYQVKQAFSGTEGILYIEHEEFALVILDLMLPGLSGEEVLERLREKRKVPVIVTSAKDSIDSKVNLLRAGAEDYITKPFEIPELLARVEVQIRRFASPIEQQSQMLEYKELVLYPAKFQALLGGQEMVLTKQEFKILELLLSNPGRVFSKQDIYDYAWEDIYLGEDKTINVHISNIRKKIKQITEDEYIETIWGIGFRLAK